MKEKKKGVSVLRWPWNLLLSVALALVLGYFIGYLWSCLLGIALLGWLRRQDPDMPDGSYCMEKTHKRLAHLGWAALCLALGVCLLVYGWMMLQEGTEGWKAEDYLKTAVGFGGGILFLLAGVYTAYTSVRDSFFPEKSTLARSIRSQLPYPEEAPGVAELFAMVDQDIKANGQWFEKIAVGKEWILGEEASYIPRIRLFFGRDEIVRRHSGNRTQTVRVLELYVMDDRRQTRIYTLRNPGELKALADCISLKAPDALQRPYSEYAKWSGSKSETEWENMLREFRVKQGEREMQKFQSQGRSGENQNIILRGIDGSVTSRVTPELVRKALRDCLEEGDGDFSLTAGRPVESFGRYFGSLECTVYDYDYDGYDGCGDEEDDGGDPEDSLEIELLLVQAPARPGEPPQEGLVRLADEQKAEEILLAWAKGEIPNLQGWEPVRLNRRPVQEKAKVRDAHPPVLELTTAAGVFQHHNTFTLEDVQVAAEGITDGTYRTVELTLRGGYLWMQVQAGDKTDGRCQVSVTRADGDKPRFFKRRCTHRQAAAWLTEFANGRFSPDWKEWKDYTRQAEKR